MKKITPGSKKQSTGKKMVQSAAAPKKKKGCGCGKSAYKKK